MSIVNNGRMANINLLVRQLMETSPDALIFGLAVLSAVLFFLLLVGLILAPTRHEEAAESNPIVQAEFSGSFTPATLPAQPAAIRLPRRIGLRSE